MSDSRIASLRVLAPLLLAMITYSTGAVLLSTGSNSVADEMVSLECTDSESALYSSSACPSGVEVWLAPFAVSRGGGNHLTVVQQTLPHGQYGATTANFSLVLKNLKVAATGRSATETYGYNSGIYNYGIGTETASFPVDIPLESHASEINYPFEKFTGSYVVVVTSDGQPVSVKASSSRAPVYGWKISTALTGKPDLQIGDKQLFSSGIAEVEFVAQRSNSSIFIIIALSLISLVVALGGLVVIVSIHREHRPPSIGALAWLATGLFATLQIRTRLPDAPPIGVRLDYFVTFPVIFCMLVAIGILTKHWVNRDDWDARNHPLVPMD